MQHTRVKVAKVEGLINSGIHNAENQATILLSASDSFYADQVGAKKISLSEYFAEKLAGLNTMGKGNKNDKRDQKYDL